jgi:organic hydroperoxide reductase OsmC/OhrA
MTDILIETTSEDGYASRSIVGDFELTLDGDAEEGPQTNPTLVATYAGCWIPAFRTAARQRDVGELGRVEVESEADLDDDGDLEAIRFKLKTEADLGDSKAEIVDRAHEICHVDAALREDLRADVVVEDDVF